LLYAAKATILLYILFSHGIFMKKTSASKQHALNISWSRC